MSNIFLAYTSMIGACIAVAICISRVFESWNDLRRRFDYSKFLKFTSTASISLGILYMFYIFMVIVSNEMKQ